MIRTTLLLAAAVFLIPAVGHAQTSTDPCSLLTPDQIKAVINSPVEAGQPGLAKGSSECTWGEASGPNAGQDRVYIALRPAAEFRTMRSNIEKSGGHAAPVTGLGDDAFFVSPDESSSALYILTKTHLLILTVTLPEPSQPATQAAEKTLAVEILPKI